MRYLVTKFLNKSTIFAFVSGLLCGLLLLRTHFYFDAPSLQHIRELVHVYPLKSIDFNRKHHGHHSNETVLADHIKKKVRIFCIILTMPENKEKKAIHVKATWARRFNGYIFISSVADSELPSIAAIKIESRDALWNKTRAGLLYAYQHNLNDYDFYMKADDDTFVIPENLRFILSNRDPEVPILMGRRFKPYVSQGYCSGGAGYVLSRAALRNISLGILANTSGCVYNSGAEDVNLGSCAEATGVKLVDSLDEHGSESFHPFSPNYMIDNSSMHSTNWIVEYNAHKITTGVECCSDHSVSFHYISASEMYALEYLIYHIYPYGINRDLNSYEKALQLLESKKSPPESEPSK